MDEITLLLQKIKQCQVCASHLPLGPNPILRAHSKSRLLIVGQAPGVRVHNTQIPWNDPSGDRLRLWMNVNRDTFYDVTQISIIPMGFCYPGTGQHGDLPPRKECASLWLPQLLTALPHIELTLLVGQYAQQHYLKGSNKISLTHNVAAFTEYLPDYFPLPHPSPRNNIWLKRNPWFEKKVLPELQKKCKKLLTAI